MDVTDVGPYTRVRCPSCGEEVRVKTEMGDFRLVRRLASGGMSVVYVARDPTLDREIAVKVLGEGFSEDRQREQQFEREAKLTAAVSHPNVVRVFKVGRAFDRFFIAMELVSGKSLEQWMSVHGALPEDAVISLALQVVDGLRAAIKAGLIHRDIKPGNILIDERETAKIVDFGLSVLTEGGPVRAEEVWASPLYVAPEALDRAEEDHRSDIYSLGATLYHVLSGTPPIESKEMGTRVLREAKKDTPPLKKVAPWLSSEMVRIVEKAMDFDPARRFQSYDEFRVALETARETLGEKGARFPVHGAVRAQRRDRQQALRRAWLAGGVSLAAVLATVAAFLVAKMKNPEPGTDEAGRQSPMVRPGSDPNLDADSVRVINEAYAVAREALADGDFVVAEGHFQQAWTHRKCPPAIAAWARFEATVAAYLDGRSSEAREHLQNLRRFLHENSEEDTRQGRRLLSSIEVLTALAYVPEERVPQLLDDPFRAITFFAMALKTWEQGQFERANRMFERLAVAGPWAESNWMEVYRALANRYLADHRRLVRFDHAPEGKSPAEMRKTIDALEELYSSLETRGRAPYNVKVWQSDLRQRLRESGD